MSARFEFTLRQSPDEKKLFGVNYRKKEIEEPEFVVVSIAVTAEDSEGVDVTDDILDDNYDGFDDNKAFFMTNYPPEGEYIIRVKSVMTDGSEQSAWGILVSAAPTLT